jgi:hypothetical protein
VYLVAPLRGDKEAAKLVFGWTDELLGSSLKPYVIFMDPIFGTKTDAFIENGLITLLSKFPGHILYICQTSCQLPSLDGILLNALPHTSQQIALGFIPDHENVYQRSTRKLEELTVDTLKIPFSNYKTAEKGEFIYTMEFEEPTHIDMKPTDLDTRVILNKTIFKTIPGWITQVSFGRRIMKGGGMFDLLKGAFKTKDVDKPKLITEVMFGYYGPYKIRNPVVDTEAVDNWKKGQFTDSEKELIHKTGLTYGNDVYAEYLRALASGDCNDEASVHMKEKCGVLRYIMQDFRYKGMKETWNPGVHEPDDETWNPGVDDSSGNDGSGNDGSGNDGSGNEPGGRKPWGRWPGIRWPGGDGPGGDRRHGVHGFDRRCADGAARPEAVGEGESA